MKQAFLLTSFLVLTGQSIAYAQGSTAVATIVANDATASEAGSDTGEFVVRLNQPMDRSVRVFYRVEGTAANGHDYASIAKSVEIPPLSLGASIVIKPVDDSDAEGHETVRIELMPSLMLGPLEYYRVGNPSNAVVTIVDDDAPEQAVVSITVVDAQATEIPEVPPDMERPQLMDPAVLAVTRTGPTTDPLTVYYSLGGTASNGVDYESLTRQVVIPAGSDRATIEVLPIDDKLFEGTETVVVRVEPPPCFLVFPPLPGCYAVGSSSHGTVFIRDDETNTDNIPPSVRITCPTNGAAFKAPATIQIEAVTVDPDGYAPTVQFFAGTNKIGEVHIDFIQAPPPGEPIHFTFEWANVPVGRYALTARAIDDRGARGVSDPVFIAVVDIEHPPTVVNIFARDADAAEQDPRLDSLPNNGLFVVERHGPTNFPLTVYYSVSGSAVNGVDYDRLSGQVVIPEGRRTAPVDVTVIDDMEAEGDETVIVSLRPPACIAIYPPPPECYQVGIASRATVVIHDDDGPSDNVPPTVTITAPADGATFTAPASIRIEAVTVDPDGYAPRVVFFADGVRIGEREIVFIQAPPDGEPLTFEMTWENVTPGDHVLTATTTDQQGATARSQPVRIHVIHDTNGPPPLPVVTIEAIDAYASEGGWNWLHDAQLSADDTNSTGEVWWVTDWHTNTATFVVRRTGETNSDLTVFYSIGGTAQNGIDYGQLAPRVTIPAGHRGARIRIWPIDDSLREETETIVLRLQPGPTTVPLYTIGRPDTAAAVVADDEAVRPPCIKLSDGMFHVCLPALSGAYYSLQGSSNLNDWSNLTTLMITDGAMHYVDTDAPETETRFYRLIPGAAASAEE